MRSTLSSRRTLRIGTLFLLAIMIPLSSILTGCSTTATNQNVKMAPMSQMPAEVQKAPTTVREAYQFAVSNPEALKNVPCYCGCGAAGHTSNYSCYVKEKKPTGEIVFDQHALGCSICVDITQDVMKMTKDGKAPPEVRAAIDKTYSQYGPSNMTAAQ
jgi:hypothetical protein